MPYLDLAIPLCILSNSLVQAFIIYIGLHGAEAVSHSQLDVTWHLDPCRSMKIHVHASRQSLLCIEVIGICKLISLLSLPCISSIKNE